MATATMTISIPTDLKAEMAKMEDINWSGFVRMKIDEKISQMKLKEELLGKVDGEMKESQFWIEKLREGREKRLKELKGKKLI